MNNQEIDRISMDIEVIVPLLSQKLGDLLAPERNIYSRSTERDRMSKAKAVLDAISAKIRVAESDWVSSNLAGQSSSDFLSKIKELENVIDTFTVKTELWRGKSFIKIMSHLKYQIRLRHVMDKLTSYDDKPHFTQEDNTGSAAATNPHTQLTQPRNDDYRAPDDSATDPHTQLTQPKNDDYRAPDDSATDPHTPQTQPKNDDYPAPDDSDFVGLEDKIDELLEKLFHVKDSDNVITVTGNAGSGKTILTKTIYNGPYVKCGFNHRAWVGVSEDFEAREILLNILIELGCKRKKEILSDNDLEMMLKNFLKEKHCLIVVDDIRTRYDLDKLSAVLKCITGWSRLILTTRNIDIAHAANPYTNPIMLRSLTDEESWTLFSKKAQIAEDILNSSVSITLKKDILEKCGDSPLAIIVLGGLLPIKELNGWHDVIEQLRKMDLRESSTVIKPAVQQSSTTVSTVSSTEIKPAVQQLSTTSETEPAYQKKIITFSYQNLPPEIKVCALYFGLFPGASEIRVRRLFHLWQAEGFVEKNLAPEDLVEKYLQPLTGRKLIKKEKVRLDGSLKTGLMPGGIWDAIHEKAEDLRRFYYITTACESAVSPNIRQLVKYTENHSSFDP